MRFSILTIAFVFAANAAFAYQPRTTQEWMALDNPHNTTGAATEAALGEVGVALEDARKFIGAGADMLQELANKI